MRTNSLGFEVALYLASNPQVELTSAQIAEMFDRDSVPMRLQPSVNAGYLQASGGVGKGNLRVYRIGPRLLRLVSKEIPK
jgi:hypothetical protein